MEFASTSSSSSSSFNALEYVRTSRSNSPISEPNFFDLSYLELETSDCEAAFTTKNEQSPSSINYLLLNNNLLRQLPNALFNFDNIETLDLSSNQLKVVSVDICRLGRLKNLIVKDNLLTDTALPKGFAHLGLELVNLSGNCLTQFPYQLLEIKSLKEIYLGQNRISVLPRNYEHLQQLQILYLGGNVLKCIPEEISQLKGLTSLNLSDNCLTSLPAKLANLKRIRNLALHGNNLTTLPIELVKLNLHELSLRNNPLVNRFAKEFSYNVPSLLELSGRTIKSKSLDYNSNCLPAHLVKYLDSAHCCLNPKCSGVYFTSKVEHVKFVDFCGKYRIPLMQYLCSSTCNEKISNASNMSAESSDSDDNNQDDNNRRLKKILLG